MEKSRRAMQTGTVNNLVLMIRWADCPFPVVSDLANNITGLPSVEVCARFQTAANNACPGYSYRRMAARNSARRVL
jgi:hypothetical protein